jgi:hypothetical protein
MGTDTPLAGQYYPITSQFSEWSVEGENWAEPCPADCLLPIQYPPLIKCTAEKPVIEFLKLNEEVEGAEVAKGKKKEAPKKGKGPAEVTEEAAYDEHGRALPRVFVDASSARGAEGPVQAAEAAGTALLRGFQLRAEEGQAGEGQAPAETEAAAADLEGSPPASAPAPAPEADTDSDDTFMREVDPLMCATFELVRRYSATLLSNPECPYLWRAIHPQLPDGRPCYNPAGRYCVKLFVAGTWRKVYVSDAVPIDGAGRAAVAGSAAPQELWPMLLSKAVYTVYTACGYHSVFANLGLASAAPSATDTAAAFVAFALHTLTGWLAAAPMAIPAGSEDSGSFLQDIAFGGCRCIALADKIRPAALSTSEIEVDESLYAGKLTHKIIRDLAETKAVKREHLKRVVSRRERDIRDTAAALDSVHAEFFCFVVTNPEGTKFRVYPILSIASEAAAPPGTQTYSPGSPTSTRLTAPSPAPEGHLSPVRLPRPAVSSRHSELEAIQLLVDWALAGPRRTGLGEKAEAEEGAEAECVSQENKGEGEAGLPQAAAEEWEHSTELTQKWVPFSDFCDSMTRAEGGGGGGGGGRAPFGVSVLSFETRSRAPLSQQMHWAWAAPAEAVEAAGKGAKAPAKGKEKDKKGGEASGLVLTPLGAPVAGADMGVFPPTLLSIDVSSVLEKRSQAAAAAATADTTAEATSADTTPAAAEGAEASAAAAAPAPAPAVQVEGAALGGAERPDPGEYVAVMVHLQGEVLAALGSPPAPAPAAPAPAAGAEAEAAPEGEEAPAPAPMTADDVVLVLQEIREDDAEPLVMRVSLSPSCLVTPVTRTTFHIPTSRIEHSPNGGRLTFWVRLFTRASVMMTFASCCSLSLGPAESIWASSEEGVVSVIDGESGPIRANLEAILFRTAYLAPAPVPTPVPTPAPAPVEAEAAAEGRAPADAAVGEAGAEGAAAGGEESPVPAPAPEQGVPAPAHSLSASCVAGARALAFLHVSDRRASHYISLLEVSGGQPAACLTLPRLGGNIISLTPAVPAGGEALGQLAASLLGKCFLPKDSKHLPGFKWKLIMLSRKDTPLSTRWTSLPASVAAPGPTIPAPVKRFAGSYTPNNKLVLFRDQLAGVPADAPIALRISLLPMAFTDNDGNAQTESAIWLTVRLVHPSTRAVVREYRGRGVVPLYAIDLKQFAAAGGDEAPVPKGKKDDKKGGKGAAAEETVSFIVECALDETAMDIPATWRSRFPYTFSEICPVSLASAPAALGKAETKGSVSALAGAGAGEAAELPRYAMPEGAQPPEVQGPEWVLDVVGGSVAAASHDLFDLLRFKDLKNSWLEKSSDRFDRAGAAVTYSAARLASRPAEEADAAGAEDEIVGLLAAALDAAPDALKPAEAALGDMVRYSEHVTPLQQGQVPAIGEPKTAEHEERVLKQGADLSAEMQAAVDALSNLNALLREDVSQRMEGVALRFESYNGELREAWKVRESARMFLNTQNSSLSFLLEKAAEAKAKVCEPEEDPKKKGKKK